MTYIKKGSVIVAGKKKVVYKKKGSTKSYVIYKKRYMNIVNYKKLKSKLQSKPKIVKKRGGWSPLTPKNNLYKSEEVIFNTNYLIKLFLKHKYEIHDMSDKDKKIYKEYNYKDLLFPEFVKIYLKELHKNDTIKSADWVELYSFITGESPIRFYHKVASFFGTIPKKMTHNPFRSIKT